MALNHTVLPQDERLPHYLRDGDPFASKLSWEADLVAGFYLTIIGILSTFGNGYVLYMSSRRKKKLRPAEIMTINLAVCDLGISVVGKPFTIISCFCHRWVFGWIGCRWYGWAGFFFGCGSLITMTAVSLDRYLKICHLSYGVWLKRKHAFICLAVIWAYAAFWTTMPLVGLGDYAPEPFGTSCTLDWWLAQASVGGQIFILNILFFCLLLPTAVIVFSYVKIIAKVKSSFKEVAHFDSRIHGSHVLEMKLTKSKSLPHMLSDGKLVLTQEQGLNPLANASFRVGSSSDIVGLHTVTTVRKSSAVLEIHQESRYKFTSTHHLDGMSHSNDGDCGKKYKHIF
ncbi:PREDICTED: opsin-5 [Galeopterus variegatus]|uniref:Opsin-5 n=1 Tax=Galeopterus variegatus TaxID=482537 RepID=A0ABM0RW16_GALVR|nr:PREDICTED: opsin-5 [Galeopterus variegatus]